MSFTTLLRRVAGHDVSEELEEQLRPESAVELTDEDLANVTGAWGKQYHHYKHYHHYKKKYCYCYCDN